MAQVSEQHGRRVPEPVGAMTATQEDIDIIWSWNKLCPEPIERCFHNVFYERAQKQPYSVAICAWDGQLFYKELNQLSTKLAHRLIELGAGSGMVIPLCFEKSMWTTVAMLGVLKSGAGFVMLDASLPEQRLQTIVRQIEATMIVSSVSTRSLSARLGLEVVSINDQFFTGLDVEVDRLPAVSDDPSSIMYLAFTSGSTGTPKGAIITHNNFVSALYHQAHHLQFTTESRTYDFSSYSFDASISNTFNTLAAGGCLCVPTEQDRIDRLAQSITALRANVTFLTPSVSQLLDPKDTPTLRTLILGGETLPLTEVKRWWGRVRLVHVYGPSECTPYSLLNSGDAPSPLDAIRIGKGAGMVTWVVDPEDHNRLLPIGYTGELLLEGPLVGKGYWNDEEKTVSAFIQGPSWLRRGDPDRVGRQERRLYKTGDLVMYNEDGSLTYVGRKDTQVKIHGQRAELGEVEHRIQVFMPETRVVVDTIISGGETPSPVLAAFIQMGHSSPRPTDAEPDIEIFDKPIGIEEALAAYLPRYMIPAVFFSVPNLPMTAAAKLDRRRLRDLGTSCFQHFREMNRPEAAPAQQSRVGTELQEILGRVLGISPALMRPDDNFFRLGGDSIAAMQAVAEAYKAGIKVTVADIFQHPILGALSSQDYPAVNETPELISPFSLLGDKIDLTALVDNVATRYELGSVAIEDAYPCTALQEGLLSLSVKYPGDYVIQRVQEVHSFVTTRDFCQAWETLVRDTAILRTRIVETSTAGLLQLVLKEGIQWIQRTDLNGYLEEDRQKPMKPGQPLARYALINDNTSMRRWFVWTLHHSLYDGWSLPLMNDMVNRVYQGIPISPAKHEFKLFIKYVTELDNQKMVEYWANALADCDCTPFPALPSSVLQPVADSAITHQIPWLDRRSREVTTATFVRTAWALLASCMTNSDNVMFGITTSGRTAPVEGINEVVGPTIATVPLYAKIRRPQKVSEYLEIMQQQATDMIPFEQFGLHRIAKTCPGAQQACKFQTLLIIQPEEGSRAEDALGEWKDNYGLEWANTFALVVEVQIGMRRVSATFDSNVIKPWVVQVLLEELEFVMQQLNDASEEQTLADINLVTPQMLERIWGWNRTVPLPVKAPIHHLIQRWTQNCPTATAISSWDGELTYGELDRLATAIAAHLVESGICSHLLGPHMLVPLCFEKSKWTLVSILGVLKAGAGFVLLDPSLPEPRLQSIFQKVGSKLLLSSEHNMDLSLRLSGMVVQIGPDLLHLWSSLSRQPITTTPCQPLPSSRAMYAVFTSGTTGEPKGVLVSHENFSSAVHYQLELLGFSRESRVLDFASYAFDAAIHNAIATLAAGGCLCIPSEQARKGDVGNMVATMKPTLANLTPTVARLLDPKMMPDLRTLILLGEPVTIRDAERWLSHKVRLINTYGPAECTPISTINAQSDTSPEKAIQIGKGVGLVTWIVNAGDPNRLLPPGCTGELLLEGPLVGNGYIKEPQRTAEAFIQDPEWLLKGSNGQPGRHGRLYKTGDLVQYNEDGSLTFMGRQDSQVKIKGQRFELAEVEHHLLNCLSVKVSQVAAEVVMPEGENAHRPVLVAFIQAADVGVEVNDRVGVAAGRYPMAADIKRKLGHHLPSYMVPTAYFSVPDLPLTATGKTNRKRLQEIGRELLLSSASEQSLEDETFCGGPISETEKPAYALAQKVYAMRLSWARKDLSEGKDGPQSRGSELNDVLLHSFGLDSVNMMELTSFISQNFHVQIGMQYLMDNATSIRGLAQHIVDSKANGTEIHPNGHLITRPLTQIDLMAEINRHDARVLAAHQRFASYDNISSSDPLMGSDKEALNVLLTGANGFVGTQILRQLLEHRRVSRVICLVRGETDDTARRRTIDSAVKALWWTDYHAEKLEVWKGDLSLPSLGLSPVRWGSLTSGQEANIIIHNGATVHWTKSYKTLEAANVGSTIQLLLLALQTPCMRFLYVTGGRPWGPDEELDVVKELSVADAIPYSQTKLVAEIVVKRAARRSSCERNRFAILNPGWVIGTPTEGFSNADDYIWRLAKTCIRIGAYNAAEADGCLSVSDATTTATAIIDAALGTKTDIAPEEHTVDGMLWSEFWAILGNLGYNLEAKNMTEWLALVRADIEAAREKHPLWPLAHMIEGLQNDERVAGRLREKRGSTSLRLKLAVHRSAQFLMRIGILPAPAL
ncbi:hypothetical protein NUU61_004920 [Penicillium alfredii]|uniref:Carrier domain-containing protein n=1 Tax=Penicillium alfredii TaxID=1506179 RepID=A0A9W9K745_9EURO|nr:uncharacterized protein NUU61_004920 [Penicillium alfredii]KAJ5095564.1 hypothetical protein NUU61_004920 [Penicillium alfredii]